MATTEIDLRQAAAGTELLRDTDSSATRETSRQRRVFRVLVALTVLTAWVLFRLYSGNPVNIGPPSIDLDNPATFTVLFMLLIMGALIGPFAFTGRSPHIVYRRNDIETKMSDVVGADSIKSEVMRSLNLFLAHKTFSTEMGGAARRGMLFAGGPGTGKTHMAKAMAGTADVPLVFVSATSFQSMYYGATARKIRAYFKTLRKLALAEGGAIGFIEEFDAIGLARTGMREGRGEGVSGVVNELLVQMQSFEQPAWPQRVANVGIDLINTFLPIDKQVKRRAPLRPNVLVIAATNRAEDLDPALLRPGRFDRTITFDLPVRRERAAITSYYLGKKSHDPEVTGDRVAAITAGFSPVMIERLLDEALICALQRGKRFMSMADVKQAQLVGWLGIARDGEYTKSERWRVAIHESGHAMAAFLLGRDVGVVSVLKRGGALGVTTHEDPDEVHLSTPADLKAQIQISLAGMVAEELECGGMSNGASGDLVAATKVACLMVGAYGMGESLLSLAASEVAFGGNLVAKVLGDEKSRTEAERLLAEAKAQVTELLSARRDQLRESARVLDTEDEIDGIRLAQIVTRSGT